MGSAGGAREGGPQADPAMTFRLDVDVERLAASIIRLGSLIDQEVAGALLDVSEIAAQRARDLAPEGKNPGHPLRGSIKALASSGSFLGETLEGGFGAGASYASYVELGTEPHEIVPVRRMALRWPAQGFIGPRFLGYARGGRIPRRGRKGRGFSGWSFARHVEHPGTKAQPFIKPAAEAALPILRSKMDAAIALACRKAGF